MREFVLKNNFIEIHTPKLIETASESGSSVFEVLSSVKSDISSSKWLCLFIFSIVTWIFPVVSLNTTNWTYCKSRTLSMNPSRVTSFP